MRSRETRILEHSGYKHFYTRPDHHTKMAQNKCRFSNGNQKRASSFACVKIAVLVALSSAN